MLGINLAMGLGRSSLVPVTYTMRDDFITDRAAGAVNGTSAEPGPGTRTAVDTDSKLTISSGALNLAPHTVPADGDPGCWWDSQSRAQGLAAVAKVNVSSAEFANLVGWDTNQSGANAGNALLLSAAAELQPNESGSAGPDLFTPATSTDYRLAVVLRTAGAFYLLKGGTQSQWTLLWVSETNSTATLYPAVTNKAATYAADYARTSQLTQPWDTAYALATDRIAGSVSESETFTHEADLLKEYTVDSIPTSLTIQIRFRIQDDDNAWLTTINSSGDFKLQEREGGSATTRAQALGALAGGERIQIVADDETISGFYDATHAWTYALAANFKTETDGIVQLIGTGAAVSDLITWPRTLSGAAVSTLDRL